MTLMEAVVALVILSLAAIGCLELSQGAARLEYNATQWNAAVTAAESRMAQLALGPAVGASNASESMDDAANARERDTRVTREPWGNGLELVTVSVPVSDGKSYELRKLLPAQARRRVSSQ